MQTPTTQIRVTLPVQLQGYLQAKASRLGLSLSAYVKNLIINDVQDVKHPVYEMSEQAVADFKQAKREEEAGTLVTLQDLEGRLTQL